MITKHNFYEKGKNPKRKEKLWTKVSKSVGAKIKAQKIKLGVKRQISFSGCFLTAQLPSSMRGPPAIKLLSALLPLSRGIAFRRSI